MKSATTVTKEFAISLKPSSHELQIEAREKIFSGKLSMSRATMRMISHTLNTGIFNNAC